MGLYTEQEERDFGHINGLLHYKEQVTGTLVHAVCSQDDECDLNPLPGSSLYSLSKLEKETIEFVELGPWDYFLVKILGPICGNMWRTHHGVPAQGVGCKVKY